jgi:hypothetical protein
VPAQKPVAASLSQSCCSAVRSCALTVRPWRPADDAPEGGAEGALRFMAKGEGKIAARAFRGEERVAREAH